MTTVYVVTYSVGGYAREDGTTAKCGGAYTEEYKARNHAMVTHGTVTPIELDVMPPGIAAQIKELFRSR